MVLSQLSFVHGLLSLQTSGVPGMQVAPLQVSAPLQTSPSEQLIAVVAGVWLHVPAALQPSIVHGLVSTQLAHAAPPLPQLAAEVAVTHVVPFQQPAQHTLFLQVPVPPLQLVRSVTAVCTHAPLLQLSVVQSFMSSQEVQAPPPVPHAVALVRLIAGAWQAEPSQQPLQQLPSSHLPVPLEQFVPGATFWCRQEPLEQLSTTHSFP